MARRKQRHRKYVTETDKDLKNIDNLVEDACELCGRRSAGMKLGKMCYECIISKDKCHFKRKKGL